MDKLSWPFRPLGWGASYIPKALPWAEFSRAFSPLISIILHFLKENSRNLGFTILNLENMCYNTEKRKNVRIFEKN